MATLVNYYPCSYGESLVNMFARHGSTRSNYVIRAGPSVFKQTEFYDLESNTIKKILELLDSDFYACHRQKGQEFYGHTTISIVTDLFDFLPKRFEKVHVQKLNKTFANPMLAAMIGKIPFDTLVIKDYEIWARQNILPHDKIIKLSWIINDMDKLANFCSENNLHYDQNLVAEIKKDFESWCL